MIARKVQSAIGADVRSGKCVSVNGDREWERNRGGAIIAMVACVGVPRRDRVTDRSRDGIVIARNGRCRRRWRRRRRRASGSIDEVKLQAAHQPARVALKLCKMRAGVALRAYGSSGAGISRQVTVDDLEVGRILVQTHLKIEGWWPSGAGQVSPQLFPEFDIEDAVGSISRYGGKHPLPARGIVIAQVVPVRSDQVGHDWGEQAIVTEILSVSIRKLQVAV